MKMKKTSRTVSIMVIRIKSKIITLKQIVKKYKIVFLGKIPFYHNDAICAGSPAHITGKYDFIANNLYFKISVIKSNIILFSSANAGEGKSTTIANLAISFSKKFGKTLLIDADMRRPVQHIKFHLPKKKGFSTAISRMYQIDECIFQTQFDNLYVMPAGIVPPDPEELIRSEYAGNLFETIRKKFDYIFVDCPPVSRADDVCNFSKIVSSVFMVVNANSTKCSELNKCIKKCQNSGMQVAGIVLNKVS